MHVVVLIPVFNDWASAKRVLARLDQAFAEGPHTLTVVLTDDGSTLVPGPDFAMGPFIKLASISVLRLKKNVGHQRALAVGLCYLSEKLPCDAVLIMDGDGQDTPEDAVRLVEKMASASQPTAVFAERTRRAESTGFRLSYAVYQVLHFALTGLRIRVGNFSVLPSYYLGRLTIEPMLWNHYAASVMRARIPVEEVKTARGQRLEGKSRLNYVGLVIHGLSALACYGEVIGVRMILLSGVIFLVALGLLMSLVGLKLFTTLTVPGWTSLVLGLVIVVILQVATLVSNFTMQIISGRSVQPFLPARDYVWFVAGIETLYTRAS